MSKEIRYLKLFLGLVILALTILVSSSLLWNILKEKQVAHEYSTIESMASYNKDLLYRRWVAIHGGVYVPITDSTPPNPYLKYTPERDITTTTGKKLTLINPAYMTRQVFALAQQQYGVKGHITSLNPIRPANKADGWETEALKLFEKGVAEYHSTETIGRTEYLRYMHAMKVEKSCLKCHAQQGYKIGDIRGGISVSVPLDKYNYIVNVKIKFLLITHIIIYAVLLFLCILGYRLFLKELKKRNSIQQKLIESKEYLRVQNNEIASLNEEYKSQNEELALAIDKIEKSEQAYREVVETTSELITVIDKQGKFKFVNHASERFFGLLPHQCITRNAFDFVHPDDVAETKNKFNVWLNSEENRFYFENRQVDIHGNIITAAWNIYIARDNEEYTITSIARDITVRKQTEESLRQKTTLFESLLRTTIDGILIIDGNGKKVFQNERTVELFNIPRELADNIDDQFQLQYVISTTKDPEQFTRKVFYLYDHPEEISEDDIELKNGTVLHRYSAPVVSKDNHYYGRIWAFRDITASKRAEEALFNANQKLELANTVSEAAIWEMDYNIGKMTLTNKMWDDFYGLDNENIANQWDKGIHDDDREKTWKSVKDHFEGKTEKYFHEFRFKNPKTGIERWISDVGKVVEYNKDGSPAKVLGVSIDITERKKAELELIVAKEKAEESDRLKTAFLQNMSHEIRTPMNAIMGFSGILLNSFNDKDKLKKYSDIIGQRCNDLLEIINDILDIAKIESGQLPVKVEVFNLTELFDELSVFFTEYKKRIGKDHIILNLHAINSMPENYIITDKLKLKQIFINLLSNAFKFTNSGKIEGGCKSGDNGKLLFYVTDSGIGVPADKHAFIFERFVQLQNNSKNNMGGTGLGLSIVKGLISLLGGKIYLESEPNKGSTFSFTIPYEVKMPDK